MAVPGLILVRKNPGGVVALSSVAALSLERVDPETPGPGKVSCSRRDNCSFNPSKKWVDALVVDIGLLRSGRREMKHPPHPPPPPIPLRAIYRYLSQAIKVLRDSSPVVFGVETPGILASKEWGPVKESMGQATRRVLPTDQVERGNFPTLGAVYVWARLGYSSCMGVGRHLIVCI